MELIKLVRHVVTNGLRCRLFVGTTDVFAGETHAALSQASVVGLSRIIASEHPDIGGALIDVVGAEFPYHAIKYVSGVDVIRVEDGVAKVARLRPMSKPATKSKDTLQPKPNGAYLITGGLGYLGLEVAMHLAQAGARRLVLAGGRRLPPRHTWTCAEGQTKNVIDKIRAIEEVGASVHCISVDLSCLASAEQLREALDNINLPPVTGVIHAAGLTSDELVMSATDQGFAKVQAPKVGGALALHQLFPPNTLDFFVFFSSCGHLLGFPGQTSYASANAFLNALAAHRRSLGDNAVSIQWTSWSGVGGMGDNELVEAELENRGITSISRREAFLAWDVIARQSIGPVTVLRARTLEAGEELAHPVLEKIAMRKAGATDIAGSTEGLVASNAKSNGSEIPILTGPEAKKILTRRVSECVAKVLQLAGPDEVDPQAALSDMGMDSVMSAMLRKSLMTTFKVKVPPTLIWGHPTVNHLVKWLGEQSGK